MKVVRHTSTELTLQERPWLAWLLGPFFAACGFYLALAAGEVVFGSIFAAVGLGVILAFGETVTSTFDLGTGQFTRENKGPLGTKRIQHALKELVGVRVTQGGGRSRTFRLELVGSSGKHIPLTSSYSSGRRTKEETAEMIRGFLELTDPGEVPIPGFRQLLGMALNPTAHREVSAAYDPVIAGYEAEIRRNPESVEAHRNLAMALAFQNKPGEARVMLEHARDLLMQDRKCEMATQFDAMLKQLDMAAARRSAVCSRIQGQQPP